MAEKADKPKTVKVEALEYHTYDGNEYQIGDTYDIDEALADSVAAQGKAVRVDRAAVAKAATKAAAKSTPVKPMTTKGRTSARKVAGGAKKK